MEILSRILGIYREIFSFVKLACIILSNYSCNLLPFATQYVDTTLGFHYVDLSFNSDGSTNRGLFNHIVPPYPKRRDYG